MTVETLQSRLAELEQAARYEPEQFQQRASVLDALASQITDSIDELLAYPSRPRTLATLQRAAEQLRQRLHFADTVLFQDLRSRIQQGLRGAPLLAVIEQLVGFRSADLVGRAVVGYSPLDRLVSGMLDSDVLPEPRREPEPEMVLNQRTPARVVFELVQRSQPGPQDVFCDIGSGTGHVATLFHLLSGAPAQGIEFEPAFCEYAQARAAGLKLTDLIFTNADARQADFTPGTLFYMYTPFEGAMLRAVLERLRERARRGPFRLATYGVCTAVAMEQEWLAAPEPAEPGSYRLAIFRTAER